MTFSMGTTPAAASPRATASNTSRKLPSEARSTSPNAARTASSANAPGSPAEATGTVSGLGGTRWGRVRVADGVVGRDRLRGNRLEGRLERCRGLFRGRPGRQGAGRGFQLDLCRLQVVELSAGQGASHQLDRGQRRLRVGYGRRVLG